MAAVGINAGRITAYLDLDMSGFASGFKSAGQELSKFKNDSQTVGQKIQSVGNTMSSVGSSMTKTVTTPIVGVGAAAVKASMDFEAGMSNVQAISGATGEDMERLRELALEMGAKTKFSSTEAADGFSYMAMAGWKTEDMLAGLPGIMYLAEAANYDLAATSDIVTDALTAFGMTAQDSGHFADILAAASSNANTNVALMGETFKYAAPIAGSLGYSAEDTAIAIGLMANAGIKGSQSGTALRSVMTRLTGTNDTASKAMDRLGLSFFDADGNALPFKDTMDILRETFQGTALQSDELMANIAEYDQQLQNGEITQEEYNALIAQNLGITEDVSVQMAELTRQLNEGTLSQEDYDAAISELTGSVSGLSQESSVLTAFQLAGMNAMSGLLAIVNASEEDYDKLTNAVYNCDGASEQMAETMKNNLAGAVVIFQSALYNAGVEIGDVMNPILRTLAEMLTDVVSWFSSLDEGTLEWIVRIVALVAALGPVLSLLGNVTKVAGGFFGIITKVGGGLAGLMSPATQATTAIAGAGTGMASAGTAATTAGGLFTKLGGVFKTVATGAKALFAILAANPIAVIIGLVVALVAAFVAFFATNEEFREKVKGVWNDVKEFIGNAVDGIVDFIKKIPENIAKLPTMISDLFDDMGKNIKNAFVNISSDFDGWGGQFIRDIGFVFGDAAELAGDVIGGIAQTFKYTFSLISAIITGDWSSIPTIIKNAIGNIGETIGNIFEGGISVIGDVVTTISDMFISLLPKNLQDAAFNIRNVVSGMFDTIGAVVGGGIKIVSSLISGNFDDVKTHILELGEKISESLNWIKEGFTGFKENLGKVFGEDAPAIFEKFISFLIELPVRLLEIGALIVNGLIDGIFGIDISDKIKEFCNNIIGWFKDLFGIHSPSTVMEAMGNDMTTGLENGLSDMPERTGGIFGRVKDTIGSWGESVVGFAQETGTKFVGWVADKFGVAEEDLGKFCSATTNVFNGWGTKTTKTAEDTSKSVQKSTKDMSDKSTNDIVKMKNDASRAINDLANNTDKSMTRAKVKAVESATGIKQQAGESIANFTKRAQNEINSWSNTTTRAGQQGSGNFKNSVSKNFSGTASSVKGSLGKTVNEVTQFGNRVEREGDQAGSGFRNNFTGEMQQVPNDFAGEMNEIPDYLVKLANVMPGHGKAIMNGLFNAMKAVTSSIKNLISGIGNSIVNMVNGAIRAFSNLITSANNAKNASNRVNGSHAGGLDYVPFNGYIAELHEGERVLTKQENKRYNRGTGNVGGGDTFNFYNTQPDPYTYARQMKKAKRELFEGV